MKLKPIKIIKGLAFILIAILFLQISFYSRVETIIFDTHEVDFNRMFNLSVYLTNVATNLLGFFVKTWHNYAFSSLFALLGILELKEGVFNGN